MLTWSIFASLVTFVVAIIIILHGWFIVVASSRNDMLRDGSENKRVFRVGNKKPIRISGASGSLSPGHVSQQIK